MRCKDRDIQDVGGGALHPYSAAERVLERMKVDLDKVDRIYSERFI